MSQATITGHNAVWTHGGSLGYLYIFAEDTFRPAGDAVTVLGGTPNSGVYAKKIACTVAGGVLTIPSFTLYATYDAVPDDLRYTAWLYDENDNRKELFLADFVVRSSDTSWDTIIGYNSAHRLRSKTSEYFDKDQSDARYLTGLSTAPVASDVVLGKVVTSVLPSSLTTPKVVADNDTRVVDNLANYGGSLAAAAAAIGATKKVLTISESVTLSADLDLTTTGITLDFATTGKITVASGKTLTIASMIDPGSRQVFAGAGAVRFANGSVPHYNAAWWAGNANGADVTTAIGQMIASAAYAGGICKYYFPQLAPVTDGGHNLGNGFVICGNANYPTAANGYGTTLRLKSSSVATYLFKVGANTYSGRFRDLILDANGVAADGVLFEANGGANTTSGDFTFSNATFNGFTRGFVHNSLSSSWQLAQVSMYDCIFQNCTTGIKTNSVNAQLTLVNTNFALGAGQKAFDIAQGGLIRIIGGEAAGAITTKTFTDANVNTTTDAITIAGHGFTNNQEVYLTTTGALPAGLVSGLLYVIYVDANTIKLSLTSGGAAINITAAAGGGTHSVNALTAMVMQISGSHGGITFDGFQDESCKTFIQNDASDISGIVNITGGSLVQSRIQLNQTCQVNIENSNLMSYALQGAPSGGYVSVRNCNIRSVSVLDGTTVVNPPVLSAMTGGALVTVEENPVTGVYLRRLPHRFTSNSMLDGNPATPILSLLSSTATSEDKTQLRYGRMDSSGEPDLYYDIRRCYPTGRTHWLGNQQGFQGIDTNGDITMTGLTVGAKQVEANTVVAAAGITASGNARAVVTAAGMPNSPKTVTVPLTTAHNTAAKIAAAFVQKLQADNDVNGFFHVQSNGAAIYLTKITAAADDATANFTIENVTTTGITNSLTSTNTVAGVQGSKVNQLIKATASLDFPNISAGNTSELTVTVTGAAIGALAEASPNTTIEAGLVWSAYVSAANTVTIRVANITGSSINPASRSWTVWVKQ